MQLREWPAFAVALTRSLRAQWRDLERLREEQDHALTIQLRHAMSAVPHYRAAWAQRGIQAAALRDRKTLAVLPLVTREQIQANPHAFLAETGDRRTWHGSRTSGSTGQPLESWFDADGWRQLKYVMKMRRLLASGWRPGHRVTIIEARATAALPRHRAAQRLLGERWVGGRSYLSVFEPPERHTQALAELAPHYLYAFPSYFAALAKVWDPSLRARIPLRALMTSGEWMHPKLRARLEQTFGVPVLDVYGSTEFKEIAWQCRVEDGYHVNMESVIVEIVDANGRPAAPGAEGDVVVTSLTNRAMPLIRYATGDRARQLNGRCRCGRGLERLDRVEGRVADYLRINGSAVVSPYELTTAIEEHPGVLEYKVTQLAADKLRVAVVLRPGAERTVLRRIQSGVSKRLKGLVAVQAVAVASIPRASSGKRRAVEVSADVEVRP